MNKKKKKKKKKKTYVTLNSMENITTVKSQDNSSPSDRICAYFIFVHTEVCCQG